MGLEDAGAIVVDCDVGKVVSDNLVVASVVLLSTTLAVVDGDVGKEVSDS